MSSTKTTATDTDSESSFFKTMGIQGGSAALVKSVVEFCLDMDQPVGIFGRAGIGKTEIIKQIAKERNMDLMILYLAHVDKEDISGFPFPDPEDNRSVLMRVKKHLPRDRSTRNGTILFLDEWNRGERPVINAMFTLMEHPRRAGDLELPDDVRIVLSGNNSDVQYSVNEAEKEPAIRRRVAWIGMVANAASWLEYASKQLYHPAVISYIRKHKQKLYDVEAHNAGKVGANPATWEKVSRALKLATDKKGGLEANRTSLIGLLSGFLGTGVASEFLSEALSEDASMIDPEDVLEGFRPGLDVYEKVKDLVKSKAAGSSGRVGQLAQAVAITIATTRPDPISVVGSVAEFSNLLDSDNCQAFFEALLKTMKEQDDTNSTYTKLFTRALSTQEAYQKARKRLTGKMNDLSDKISGA